MFVLPRAARHNQAMATETINTSHHLAGNKTGVNDYRQQYRYEVIPPGYSGRNHLYCNFGGGLLVCLICVLLLDRISWAEALVPPIMFIYANLAEYAGHRWVMHRLVKPLKEIFTRHTKQHHRFFTRADIHFDDSRDYHAVLFPPMLIGFFFGLFGIPMMVLIGWLWSWDAALLAMLTAVVYYLMYEAAHFVCHMRDNSWPHRFGWVRHLVGHHRVHHDPELMSRYHFNFAIPLGDVLFGTCYRRRDSRQNLP